MPAKEGFFRQCQLRVLRRAGELQHRVPRHAGARSATSVSGFVAGVRPTLPSGDGQYPKKPQP